MRNFFGFFVLFLTVLAGCGAQDCPHNPYNPPCSDGSCVSDPVGPEGWSTMAQDIWDYYKANTPFHGPDVVPKDIKWHWYVKGNDTTHNDQDFWADGDPGVAGDTIVWPCIFGNSVSDIYIMDWGIDHGVLHHELLHAWLAYSTSGLDGDQSHSSVWWSTVLPQAQKDIPYAY